MAPASVDRLIAFGDDLEDGDEDVAELERLDDAVGDDFDDEDEDEDDDAVGDDFDDEDEDEDDGE